MTEPAHAMDVVYVIDVAERPGIVHAIAAVFAHRGLSMRALYADAQRRPPRVLVVFSGTPRQVRLVAQVLARLHDIHDVRLLPADSPELHAVALCRGGPGLPPALEAVGVQQLADGWLLSGPHAAVELAVARLREAGLAEAVSRSLVVL